MKPVKEKKKTQLANQLYHACLVIKQYQEIKPLNSKNIHEKIAQWQQKDDKEKSKFTMTTTNLSVVGSGPM